jgi:hypothetical protein
MEYPREGQMDITQEEANKLKESLSGITDWRGQSGHLLHRLIDALVIGLTTVVARWSEYSIMEDFGKAKLDFFKTFLELPHGIPDEKTFSRLFARINPTELAACLGNWLEEVSETGGREINIDGKAICGSACKGKGKKAAHIVSAWAGAHRATSFKNIPRKDVIQWSTQGRDRWRSQKKKRTG